MDRVYPTVDNVYPTVDRVYPTVDRVYPAVDNVYPTVDRVYPTVDKGYPTVDRVYPTVDNVYPTVDNVYPSVDDVHNFRMNLKFIRSSREHLYLKSIKNQLSREIVNKFYIGDFSRFNSLIFMTETILSTRPSVTTKKQLAPISGSECLIRSLIAAGVKDIFGYPGGAIMPVYDTLHDHQIELKHYLARHEQGAVHAAQGYARVKRTAGIVIATSGPGATNLITGIADALADSTPLICITGQVFKHLLGTDAFQETDIISMSMPVTKWNYQITEAKDVSRIVAKAFYIAKSGRPGPVLIDITKNAQIEKAPFHYRPYTYIRSYQPVKALERRSLQKAATYINQAKKPLILAGQGVLLSEAQTELRVFVEKTGIPVACTLLGLSCIARSHPLYVGYLGMHGNYGPNVKTNETDLIIALGMRFDDRVTGNAAKYAPQAKIIHIDIDPAEINKIIKADVPLITDAKLALRALLPRVKERDHAAWLEEFKVCDRIESEKVIRKDTSLKHDHIKMGAAIRILSKKTAGKAIIVADVGQNQMATSRYYQFEQDYSCITSGGLGTMGFALPAAIGAKIAAPTRTVVAIIGDGGIQMTFQELGVIMEYKIPVKIMLLNNNFLGMVRQWQQLFFEKRYSFVDLTNPNFEYIAKAYGIRYQKVSTPRDLERGIENMLAEEASFFLELIVEKEENVFPMIPTGASVSEIRLE